MEDIILKYKKRNRNRNIHIVILSLVLAFWLNLFFSSTEGWKYIKSSILNNNIWTIKKSDLYIENIKNSWNLSLNIKSSKEMEKIKSISFSLIYNNNNVVIRNKKVNYDDSELLNLSDNNWYNTIILNFKNPTNINAWETLLNLILEKKENREENINLINSNMIDSDNNLFMLSSSWIKF